MERFWAASVLKKIRPAEFYTILSKKALFLRFRYMNHPKIVIQKSPWAYLLKLDPVICLHTCTRNFGASMTVACGAAN